MNVVAKINCYFEPSVVTLKSLKEYLNTMTYNTPVLLRIKYWTIWYIERYSISTYTEVTNFQKTVRFLAHPVLLRYYLWLRVVHTHVPLSPSSIIWYQPDCLYRCSHACASLTKQYNLVSAGLSIPGISAAPKMNNKTMELFVCGVVRTHM